MLIPFRRRKAPDDAPSPSVGPDRRIYAIGDVHGRDLEREIVDDDVRLRCPPGRLIRHDL